MVTILSYDGYWDDRPQVILLECLYEFPLEEEIDLIDFQLDTPSP